jgi:tetratricopeptide (TPR) repeat protein
MRPIAWQVLVLLCSHLSTWVVSAQSPSDAGAMADAEPAREHFEQGERAYNRGDYSVAIREWEAAYAIDARPRIQYNIYQAHERLGNVSAAIEALQRYLDEADRSDPSYENAVVRMANLQQRLQATGIELIGVPRGAWLHVDDEDFGQLNGDLQLPMPPGQHRVRLSLEDHHDFFASVFVVAGQFVQVPVRLEPSAELPQPTEAAPSPPGYAPDAIDRSALARDPAPLAADLRARPFFFVSAGLAAGALFTGVWALNRAAELDGCHSDRYFCANEEAVTGERSVALLTTTVLGLAAVGMFAYGIVIRVQGDEGDQEDDSFACAPVAAGALCRLRF